VRLAIAQAGAGFLRDIVFAPNPRRSAPRFLQLGSFTSISSATP
jgi:hypothetical protein